MNKKYFKGQLLLPTFTVYGFSILPLKIQSIPYNFLKNIEFQNAAFEEQGKILNKEKNKILNIMLSKIS
jgi:hypothetical protein